MRTTPYINIISANFTIHWSLLLKITAQTRFVVNATTCALSLTHASNVQSPGIKFIATDTPDKLRCPSTSVPSRTFQLSRLSGSQSTVRPLSVWHTGQSAVCCWVEGGGVILSLLVTWHRLLLNREKVKYFCSTYRELCDEYHREIIHHVNIFLWYM